MLASHITRSETLCEGVLTVPQYSVTVPRDPMLRQWISIVHCLELSRYLRPGMVLDGYTRRSNLFLASQVFTALYHANPTNTIGGPSPRIPGRFRITTLWVH